MNGMVGGEDVIFETTRKGFDLRPILDAVLELWPDCLFQNAEEADVRLLTAVLTDEVAPHSREFFVYRDKASADSWIRDGWTEEHANDLAHFLVVEDAAHPDTLQLTLVIGSVTGETVCLIGAVHQALTKMSQGEAGLRECFHRVDWDSDLRAAGYTLGREQFYEKVEEIRMALFSNWTADELACHPHEALQFCEVVRRVVAPVPDHLVMKALLNRRKGGEKKAGSVLPRLVWRA